MPRHVGLLEEAAGPEQKSEFSQCHGRHQRLLRLAWHDVESYFRPNTIRSDLIGYRDDPGPISLDKRFGVAVMMDCSRCPIHPALRLAFANYTKRDSAIIRAHGARPVLFMSWAYADRPEMTALLEEAYTVAGNANAALVIPAGLAFAHALQRQPQLNLYAGDKSHPSLAGNLSCGLHDICRADGALAGRKSLCMQALGSRRPDYCKRWRGTRCKPITGSSCPPGCRKG